MWELIPHEAKVAHTGKLGLSRNYAHRHTRECPNWICITSKRACASSSRDAFGTFGSNLDIYSKFQAKLGFCMGGGVPARDTGSPLRPRSGWCGGSG
eukprot:1195159-Prorocentrum_minimum.AAC.3